jgi:hypothetical protein
MLTSDSRRLERAEMLTGYTTPWMAPTILSTT